MYGRCETDPFDQAIDVCDSCYGEFCASCLVTTKSRKHPICKECALIESGIRPGAKPLLRGSKRTAAERRRSLRDAPTTPRNFSYFDDGESASDGEAGAIPAALLGVDRDSAAADEPTTELDGDDRSSTGAGPAEHPDGGPESTDPTGPDPVGDGSVGSDADSEERRHPFLPNSALVEPAVTEPAPAPAPAPTGMAALAEHAGRPTTPEPIDAVSIDEPPPWASPPDAETEPTSPWPTAVTAGSTAPSPWAPEPAADTQTSTPWSSAPAGADDGQPPPAEAAEPPTQPTAVTTSGTTEPVTTPAPRSSDDKPVTDGFDWVSQMPARGSSPPLPSRSAGGTPTADGSDRSGNVATVERAPAGLPRRRTPRPDDLA